MYQVTFSDQSIRELNKLSMPDQLELIDTISNITSDMLATPKEPIGKFDRNNKTFYRVRAGEFRCYFEIEGDVLYAQYILHKNTLSDFIFRMKLPVSEELMAEQHQSFWKYLESLR